MYVVYYTRHCLTKVGHSSKWWGEGARDCQVVTSSFKRVLVETLPQWAAVLHFLSFYAMRLKNALVGVVMWDVFLCSLGSITGALHIQESVKCWGQKVQLVSKLGPFFLRISSRLTMWWISRYLKDHLTLQWKGLNLHRRGWVLKIASFEGSWSLG